ncbi:alpha/beta fold hydrolase [Microbacterium sp. cx-59]|uniref:alpha/beta fold hydrolase n=1 Tax=Microbacterium sp. cx-59 TaxID=2891207 RepID=UPI001E4054FA|nr:alpha/beta fold hydrolase [Microbacterium sp. cx-59]MCC4908148.1 alpha/beta hydrolase [Microbacterium sp. cx-59]
MPARAHRRNAPDVTVDVTRVRRGAVYARVSTIAAEGERAFVLVAGIGVAATYFERLAPHLNEFGAVHALDLPGFGGVPHPGRAMTIAQYADLVEAVIDDLQLHDPILIGHSMGTQLVAEVAARRADLQTVVLIGPVVDPHARRLPVLAWRFLRATWHEPLKVKLLALSAYLTCGFRWFFRILPVMMRFPIEDRFAKIRARTLVIRGEHDAVVPREWAQRVAESIPFASTWEIGGAGHSVMHGHADGVAKLCLEFARMPRDTDDLLNRMSDAEAEVREPLAATPGAAFRALVGRLRETVGVWRRDDRLIARGKTEHARAMAEDRPRSTVGD